MLLLGNDLAILFWLKLEYLKDEERWFCITDISRAILLSRDRTGRHLRHLTFKMLVDTKIDKWSNVYRFRR